MQGISKSILYTFYTQVPAQLFGIIAGVFITRILGAELRGIYAIFYADLALFSTILGFSINTAIAHFKAKQIINESTLLSVSLVFSLITVALSIGTLFFWLSLPIADVLFPSEHLTFHYLILFIVFIILEQVNTVYSAFFQGSKRFDVVNRVLLTNSIANLTVFGACFIMHEMELLTFNLVHILGLAGLVLLFNTIQWHRHFRRHFNYTIIRSLNWRKDFKPFFKFMGLGHLSIIINFFNYRLVLWIIAYYLDNEQIGIFALGAGLAQLIFFISNPISQILMPYMSAEGDLKRIVVFSKFARLHFTVVCVLSFFSIFVLVPLIPILYGADFENAGHIYYLSIVGIIFSAQTKQIASYFISSNKLHLNLFATLVGFSLTFGLNFWFVKEYGIYGAAIAQSVTYFGIFLFVYLAFLKFTNLKGANLFLARRSDIDYAIQRFREKTTGH